MDDRISNKRFSGIAYKQAGFKIEFMTFLFVLYFEHSSYSENGEEVHYLSPENHNFMSHTYLRKAFCTALFCVI